MTDLQQLRVHLLDDRLATYARLRGGFPIPLAGVVYWAALGVAGHFLELPAWSMTAFVGSGAIFPLALGFAALFKNGFMKDRSAVGGVLLPAFVAMLLFWTLIVAAVQEAPSLVPLILAVGLSLHWPVIGWSYARTALFSAHAVTRSILALLIWLLMPDARLTLLPLSVAAVYLATVFAILIDSKNVRAKLEM